MAAQKRMKTDGTPSWFADGPSALRSAVVHRSESGDGFRYAFGYQTEHSEHMHHNLEVADLIAIRQAVDAAIAAHTRETLQPSALREGGAL